MDWPASGGPMFSWRWDLRHQSMLSLIGQPSLREAALKRRINWTNGGQPSHGDWLWNSEVASHGMKQQVPYRETMTLSLSAWDVTRCISWSLPRMVANPTLRFNLANPKASTRLHDLSHIIHVDTKGATMSHIPLDRHPANNGHLTNLMVVSGSKMVDPDGTKINGTNLGPRIRNRDSTGSLLSLWERYPTDLLSILVQAATHRFLWFQILLNNLVVTWWFSAGLMVSQRAHGCYNNFLAPFARSLHGR